MEVVRFLSLDQLARFRADWDHLAAGVPFRTWAWISTWWRHYGAGDGRSSPKSLYVLGVLDRGDRLVGIAPWYLESSISKGRVLRFLGSGEICSEYLTVLAEPEREDDVAEAVAEWLTQAALGQNARPGSTGRDRWDLLELIAVDAGDRTIARLAAELRARGNLVHQRPGPSCWRIDLPDTWNEYLDTLSRWHRRQLRTTERRLIATGRAVFHLVRRPADLSKGLEILSGLHQRRHRALGEPGCFASPRFTAFHREVVPLLLASGRLQLFWVELDGRPVVAEYFLLGDDTTYAYQTGVEPESLKMAPGRLGNMFGLRHAMATGRKGFDFLRGDEPYKAHWRARPQATVETRVAPDRVLARVRLGLWLTASRLKRWAKAALRRPAAHALPPPGPTRDEPEKVGSPVEVEELQAVAAAPDRSL